MKPFERLRRLASDYEAGVSHSRADQIAAAAMLRARPQSVRRRWPAVAVATATLAIGIVGMGALSDQAVPGQVLYPLDRAYESVGELMGFNQNQSEERLVEAIALIDRGRGSDAILLVDEALFEISRDPDLEDYRETVAAVVTPPVTTTTQPPASGAGPPPTSPSTDDAGAPESATAPVVTTPPETSGGEPIEAVVASADPETSLRLATEYLLRTVRDAKVAKTTGVADGLNDEFQAAASEIIAAAQIVEDLAATTADDDIAQGDTTTTSPTETTDAPTTTIEPADGTTTTTEPADTSTTTIPEDGSTTTTVPEDGSTTTTVPEDGATSTTTVPQGPIVLPVQP